MTVPAKQQEQVPASTIESVIVRGDLSKLNESQRTEYYVRLCQSLGLNPLTKPFEYLNLNGKLVLYALRACADQLRKINGISLQIVSQDMTDELLTVHVKAKDKDGREDEDLGVVNLPETLKGEARANTILKAVTKAKRRVTLSISGLGFLDETEVEDIPQSAKEPKTISPEPPSKAAAALIEIQKEAHGDKASPEPEYISSAVGAKNAGEPREITLGDSPDWIWFGQTMIALSGGPQWADWDEANRMNFNRMENEAPKVYARMNAAIKKVQKA